MYTISTMIWRSLLLLCLLWWLPSEAWTAGPAAQAEIAYSKALLQYEKQEYATAEQGFARASQLDPQNFHATYFLGMSHFQQEEYQEAVDAFNKAIALKQVDPEPYYYRGIALYRLGQRRDALDDFIEVSNKAPEGEMQRMANAYILNIESGDAFLVGDGREKPWFIYADLAVNFDSNVTLDPEDVTISTLPSDQDDAQFVLMGGGGYHIVQKKNYRLTGEAFYVQTLYPDLSGFNYGLAHADITNQFRWGKGYTTIELGDEFSILATSKYLNSILAHLHHSQVWSKTFLTRVGSYTRRNIFFQNIANPAQNRDAWNLQPGIDQYFYFMNQRMYFDIYYRYEHNFATGNDWDFHAHRVGMAYFTPIAWKVYAYLFAEFLLDKDFNNVDSVLGMRRDDSGQYAGIQFSREVHEYVTVRIHYSFLRNASNLPIFQYNRHLAGAAVSFRM